MIDELLQPKPGAFLDISTAQQVTDGSARCISVAMCDEHGEPVEIFYQGQIAHFFYEFEITGAIGVPSGGLEFHDSSGQVIHGKNTFQYGTPAPHSLKPGTRLSYHHAIKLDVAPGSYWFTLGLASTDEAAYEQYVRGPMGFADFREHQHEHCRVIDAGSFSVELRPTDKLLHHGVANLPGDNRVNVLAPGTVTSSRYFGAPADSRPTVFHLTHWKAGSQWIYKILQDCAGDHIVRPEVDEAQFLRRPVKAGKVYPTVYVTKQQFEQVRLPPNWSRFVVIRDLRDTLVSAYFSFKVSHPILSSLISRWRSTLHLQTMDDGLIYLMDEWLPACASIQASWIEAGERTLRYEDLLEHDLELLEPVLLDECELPVSRERFRQAVLKNRFERLTKGRERGREDISKHERKGIAGDWRNHFDERVKQEFKQRFGQLLIATGYERDMNW